MNRSARNQCLHGIAKGEGHGPDNSGSKRFYALPEKFSSINLTFKQLKVEEKK